MVLSLKLISNFVFGGSIAMKVNDDAGRYFQTKKMFSMPTLFPTLFKIIADMLSITIERAKVVGQIEGMVPHLVDGGLYVL
jgi:hypothetical protein